MEYVFDTLGYRRYEWKCDNLNAPSKRVLNVLVLFMKELLDNTEFIRIEIGTQVGFLF